jgi:hypothetical protein
MCRKVKGLVKICSGPSSLEEAPVAGAVKLA